jgi:hypothetical protein
MRILFFFSHPAQFHFSKLAIEELKMKSHRVDIIAKTKDVLTQLIDETGWEYYNIQSKERGRSRLSIFFSLLKRDIKLFFYCFNKKYNLLIGTDASLAHVGFILRIPIVTILEDDYNVIRTLANLTFPFTSYILTPYVCRVGKWNNKKIGYDGYMKLAYLHPLRFSPDSSQLNNLTDSPFFLIRLSGLRAHHDFGIKGISETTLERIIEKLILKGRVYISSEKPLPDKFQKFILKTTVSQIHHLLYYTELLICDSQSMAVEASILGTPSVRISEFSGRISVLEELENKYQLTFGFNPERILSAMHEIDKLLLMPARKDEFRIRRDRMLADKIEVTGFLIWFIENFPGSALTLFKNPDYQQKFKVRSNRQAINPISIPKLKQPSLISNSS